MKPPILLVHGACSQALHMEWWRAWFVAAGYSVAAPDLPGHGADRTPLGRLRLKDYVAALRAVAAGFGRPPVVIGHSMGGLLAQRLAASTDCSGIVLLASMPSGWFPPSLRALPWFLPLGPVVLAGRPFRPSVAGLRALTLHDLARAEQDEILPDFVAESGGVYREMLLGRGRVAAASVRCPVLVVNGGADRLVPAWVARTIARRYRAELRIVPGRGHWLIAGSLVTTVAPEVLRWIGGLERRSPAADPSFRVGGTV